MFVCLVCLARAQHASMREETMIECVLLPAQHASMREETMMKNAHRKEKKEKGPGGSTLRVPPVIRSRKSKAKPPASTTCVVFSPPSISLSRKREHILW